MTRKKIEVSAGTPRWKCLESRTDSKRLHYGRFSLSPLMKGQADTIGIVMRRTLLGEVEGTCITRAKFENVRHEYTTIFGVEESVHEVLMNLKEIVLRSDLYGIRAASISARGPGYVTAQDIFLPRYVEIVDTAQHIASLTKPIDLRMKLQIERSRGYRMRTPKDYQDQSYPIDAVSMPVRNVNYSIHSRGNEKQEMLFLEIWTNGSLTPREALYEASHNLMHFFIPFLDLDTEEQNLYLDIEDNQNGFPGRFTFTTPALFTFIDNLHKKKKKKRETSAKYIFLDQLGLRYSIYTRLKGAKIHRLSDLLSLTHKDLVRMRIQLHAEDIKKICDFLERHSLTLIPESKD